MKKSLRFITLILAVVFLISGTVMIVGYAAPDEEVEVAAEAQEQVDTADDQPADDSADADEQDAQADEEPLVDDDKGEDMDVDDNQGAAEDQQSDDNQADDSDKEDNDNQTGDAEQTSDDDAQSGDGSNENQAASAEDDHSDEGQQNDNEDDDEDYNNYVEEDDEPLYYGDASNYDYNIPEGDEGEAKSVSSQTSQYNTSGMSEKDVVPNQWSDIKLDEKTVTTGVADFSSIKSNTGSGDNGDWLLYLGYILIGLSVLGIIYFIVATVTQRKAAQKAERSEHRRSSAPARSEAARMAEKERRASGTQKRTSRFADEAPGYSRRASSKADTGEIYIPRRATKK